MRFIDHEEPKEDFCKKLLVEVDCCNGLVDEINGEWLPSLHSENWDLGLKIKATDFFLHEEFALGKLTADNSNRKRQRVALYDELLLRDDDETAYKQLDLTRVTKAQADGKKQSTSS